VIRQTFGWLWEVIRNPDVVWVDTNTGEETRERWSRWQRFHIFRPSWTHYALTTKKPCGCRKRLGLWRVIFCSEHADVWLEGR
jgi:hypothetical protein